MFENIGKKIKTLAEILFIIGVCCSVIIGVLAILYPNFLSEIIVEQQSAIAEKQQDTVSAFSAFWGLIWIAIGFLFSYIHSLLLYGFGELIDRISNIDENLILQIHPSRFPNNIKKKYDMDKDLTDNTVFCPNCGADVTRDKNSCHVCGEKIRKDKF